MVKLFNNKYECCGCGACLNICPKKAISMKEDEYGFVYPDIDYTLCVNCKMCEKVCNFKNRNYYNENHNVFAAVTKNTEILMNSTSGGVFSTIAKSFLEDGGYIAGAIYDKEFNVKHIVSNKYEDLLKIQGSKYVQSSTDYVFKEVRELLSKGHKVLFSGTPCQIDGLYGYLLKDYSNLYTMDLVCHGVPSNKFFKSYLNFTKKDKEIKSIRFRDKKQSWGKFGLIKFKDGSFKIINSGNSAFYYLFNESSIFRDSCYSCKYASRQRPGDLTIGDYWGIEFAADDLLKKEGLDEKNGISLIISNSEKGVSLIKKNSDNFYIYSSTFEDVSKYNNNLNKPSNESYLRSLILKKYVSNEFEGVAEFVSTKLKKEKIKLYIKKVIPQSLKRRIKKSYKGG